MHWLTAIKKDSNCASADPIAS